MAGQKGFMSQPAMLWITRPPLPSGQSDHCLSHARDQAFHLSRRFLFHEHEAASLGETKQTLRRLIMKTILSALVALSALAGVVAPAAASDFSIKQLDQDNRGGHNYGGSVLEQLDKEGRGGHNT
jgi:hypothetical protein